MKNFALLITVLFFATLTTGYIEVPFIEEADAYTVIEDTVETPAWPPELPSVLSCHHAHDYYGKSSDGCYFEDTRVCYDWEQGVYGLMVCLPTDGHIGDSNTWSECMIDPGSIAPGDPENGLDDDCDGNVDEGFADEGFPDEDDGGFWYYP